MNRSLLAATKFSLPALPRGYVDRPRLHDVLDQAADLPLTVVVGMPGSGKSVLLASWLRERPPPRSIWLSCDARDAEPRAFWMALATALGQEWPDRGLDVPDLLNEADPDLDDVAVAVVNDLAAIDEPVVLVIDDFQFASSAAPGLVTLIDRLPAHCRLIVGSRVEPPLELHRLRAYGKVHELRDADLRLTGDEVPEFLDRFDVHLDETQLEIVATHTEGWIAGVQMAAVSMHGHPDPDRFLTDLAKSRRATTDFLGTEVLDRQPQDLRDFLVETSILDVLEPESCAAVTGRDDASSLLGQVEERNLFLIELEPGSYRYHHLFSDLLRQRLRTEGLAREELLHVRAGTYFSSIGDPVNAVGHLLAGGRDDEAFEVLQRDLVSGFYQGDGQMLPRLVDKVESQSALVDPAYLPFLAVAMAASGPAPEADRWIRRAGRHRDELSAGGRGLLAVAQGLMALRNGEPEEVEHALLPHRDLLDLPEVGRFGYVPSLLARSRLWLGDAAGARAICEEGVASAEEPSAKFVVMADGLAWVACVEGHLTEAEQLAQNAWGSAEAMGLARHPIATDIYSTLGRVAFERGDLSSSERMLEHAISIAEDVRPAFALLSYLVLSRVCLAGGRPGEAVKAIELGRSLLPTGSTSPLLGLADAAEARIAIEIGDLDRAEALARSDGLVGRAARLTARLHLARGDWELAAAALDTCRADTLRIRLDVAVLAARIAHAGRLVDSDRRLAEAIDLARAERFVMAVTDDMPELRPRVAATLRPGRIGPFEAAVLNRIDEGPVSAPISGGTAGPLSEREVTVVRYLASRLTNKEIASELFVSTNTLKTHVQRIYRKLGVSSRTEAVTEARRLGVL